MKNILVVNVNWLGDAVFSTPVFKALKKAYPYARITCLCVPRVSEVLEYCPFVDRIIIFDERGKHRMPWRKFKLIQYLKKEKFDACFLLHRSMTRALMVYFAGIPLRIGFGKYKKLLTHPIDANSENIHRSDYYLKVLENYGIRIQDRTCELRLKIEDVHIIESKLNRANIGAQEGIIVINTGGNWELKRWGMASFAHLTKRIHLELGLKIVFSGASKDKEFCQRIIQTSGVNALILAGETSLGQSLALYKRALVVISADSGPLHLANSVGADVIGIYGPTRPEITGPRGTGQSQILFKEIGCNKAPCYHLSCSNNVCMQSITVDDVFQALKRIKS